MKPYQKRIIILLSVVFLPTSLLAWILHRTPVSAATSQASQTVYLPQVFSQIPAVDIAVTAIDPPTSQVVLGDLVDLGVTLENQGEQDVSVEIPVLMTDTTDMLPIGTQSVSALGVGLTTTLTFTWDTGQVLRPNNPVLDSGFESGGVHDHALIAAHDLDDDYANNDSQTTLIPLRVWEEYSSLGLDLILPDAELPHITPHTGGWAVWLGGDSNENSSISQLVTIPENNPVLVYWYWIQSTALYFRCDSIYEGTGGVKINSTPIGQDRRLCGDKDTGWLEEQISLNAYAGQTVVLEFWVQTPLNYLYGGPSLYIDDVSIGSQ